MFSRVRNFIQLLLVTMVVAFPTITHMQLMHTYERSLFWRCVNRLGKNPIIVKRAMSMWLWLKEVGHFDIIMKVIQQGDALLEGILNETLSCLDCLSPNSIQPMNVNDIPILAGLLNKSINRRRFYENRDTITNRVSYILDTVCNLIFEEHVVWLPLYPVNPNPIMIRPNEWYFAQDHTSVDGMRSEHLANRQSSGEGSSTLGQIYANDNQISRPSTLNPFARPFYVNGLSNQRALVLTITQDQSLSREEIIQFFISRWGHVVDVVLEDIEPNVMFRNGKVIFSNASLIQSVLNGEERVTFLVGNKPLWVTKFVSQT